MSREAKRSRYRRKFGRATKRQCGKSNLTANQSAAFSLVSLAPQILVKIASREGGKEPRRSIR